MTLKQYLKKLNRIAEDHPELLSKQVIYCIDDEGNEYKPVYYSPSYGWDRGYDFIIDDEFDINNINAICLN